MIANMISISVKRFHHSRLWTNHLLGIGNKMTGLFQNRKILLSRHFSLIISSIWFMAAVQILSRIV